LSALVDVTGERDAPALGTDQFWANLLPESPMAAALNNGATLRRCKRRQWYLPSLRRKVRHWTKVQWPRRPVKATIKGFWAVGYLRRDEPIGPKPRSACPKPSAVLAKPLKLQTEMKAVFERLAQAPALPSEKDR
jgi:hypothetical protein